MNRLALVGVALATALCACEPPPLAIRFTLTDGDSQQCIADTGNETTSCDDVTMACKGVLSVRIVPPNQPLFPYVYVCKPLVGDNTLCAIAGIDLPQPTKPVPEQVLEVQMAVFTQDSLIAAGLRDANGNFECPIVDFAANGLPEPTVDCTDGPCPVRPAVGGRAFYYPGDETTLVKLGCTDPSLLTAQSCKGPPTIEVIATVNDFDTWVDVASTTADRLTVSIGEPKGDLVNGFSLTSPFALPRIAAGVQTWSADLDFAPQSTYCVEVFEDVPQATRALVCRQVSGADLLRIDITGALLSRTTLSDILTALGKTIFPDTGLVVGLVLNQFNQPVANATVAPTCPPGTTECTVQYLSADRKTLTSDKTSSNGIWISTNAPYGSTFTWSGQVQPGFGGRVQGKVTIVVLQESAPMGGT